MYMLWWQNKIGYVFTSEMLFDDFPQHGCIFYVFANFIFQLAMTQTTTITKKLKELKPDLEFEIGEFIELIW